MKYFEKTNEIFEKTRSLNDINFKSFQRKSANTLCYAQVGQKYCCLMTSLQ